MAAGNSSNKQGIASQQNIMHAVTLAGERAKAQMIQSQLAQVQKELQQLQKDHETLSKKKELDDEHHKETRKELDKMKTTYDANSAWEKKVTQKDTMERARRAKTTVKKEVTSRGKTQAKTNKSSRAKSSRPRKAS